MKEKDRQKIFDKYGGRCAYCGCKLNKRWNVDHIEPVVRIMKTIPGYWQNIETKEKVDQMKGWRSGHEYIRPKQVFDRMTYPERDTIENSLPSCHSCNITKSSMPLEEFREWIQDATRRLNTNNYASYKFAKRYGLIQETGIEVKFYFETLTIEQNDTTDCDATTDPMKN